MTLTTSQCQTSEPVAIFLLILQGLDLGPYFPSWWIVLSIALLFPRPQYLTTSQLVLCTKHCASGPEGQKKEINSTVILCLSYHRTS